MKIIKPLAFVRHMSGLRILSLYFVLFLSAACASSSQPRLFLQDHPLVDKIWDTKREKFITRAELHQSMLATEYLLLGERHDNMVHHRYQSWAIQQLRNSGKQASVAFEMIDDRQGKLLARHRISSVEQIIGILNQYKTHWYYEQRYKALFTATMKAAYPIIPANLNRQRLKQITAKGEDSLPKAYAKMLAKVPLTGRKMQSLVKEIKASHCNMLGDKATAKLVLSQRVRDAVMAHSLTKIRTPIKVFIAGAGHVRSDRGVPLYLAKYKKGAKIMALGFTEVEEGKVNVMDYTKRWGGEHLPFDYVWFTPQVKRKDLCAQFEQHMKNINKHSK